MRNNIALFIGGNKVSGAEKRILKTFSLLAKLKKLKVIIVISDNLKEEFCKRSDLSEDLKSFYKVISYKTLFEWQILNFFTRLYISLKIFLDFKNNWSCYFCLISPLHFPLITLKSKINFEVTSPDIVHMRSMGLLTSIMGKRLNLIAVSESVYDRLKKSLSVKNLDLEISLRTIPFAEPIIFNTPKKKSKKIIFAHRLISRKNPVIAAKAFVDLANEFDDWEFLLFGDGPLSPEIKDIFNNSQKNAKFIGRSIDLKNELYDSYAFVSLIEPDNYPSQSVLEAMSLGNLLIISDTGYSKDKFFDANGYLVEIKKESVATAIRQAIYQFDNNDNVMGEKSISIIKNRFSLDNYLNETHQLIK